jgi:molybdopterin-biosynthesis enzyme MoeA-like protein
MMEWVLDRYCEPWFERSAFAERSVVVYGSMEASLTPMMLKLEEQFAQIKVFSLPSVDHPVHGRHIELGVKGPAGAVAQAYPVLLSYLHGFGASLGPELVR